MLSYKLSVLISVLLIGLNSVSLFYEFRNEDIYSLLLFLSLWIIGYFRQRSKLEKIEIRLYNLIHRYFLFSSTISVLAFFSLAFLHQFEIITLDSNKIFNYVFLIFGVVSFHAFFDLYFKEAEQEKQKSVTP